MAVRFLPPPSDDSGKKLGEDRENLAEVIEFRSKLREVSVLEAPASARTPLGPVSSTSPVSTAASASNTASASTRRRQAWTERTMEQESSEVRGSESDAAIDQLEDLELVRTAMDDAVRMLARRARSSGELRRELLAKGHDHAEVDEVLLECETRLYLDDLGLARVVTETLRSRKRASRSQIRLKLRERLLPDGVIEEAIGELDQDEENELLREAASERARKMSGLDRQTAERRLIGFLARRGWSGERAVRIAREALERNAQRPGSSIGTRRSSTLSAVPSSHNSGSGVRFQ